MASSPGGYPAENCIKVVNTKGKQHFGSQSFQLVHHWIFIWQICSKQGKASYQNITIVTSVLCNHTDKLAYFSQQKFDIHGFIKSGCVLWLSTETSFQCV